MTFLDQAIFPPDISYGSSGGPSFGNIIHRTPAGRVSVLQLTIDPPSRWSVRWEREQFSTSAVLNFARVTHGALHGFRFLDFNDFSSAPTNDGAWSTSDSSHRHEIGVGDGTTVRFPIQKVYSAGGSTKSRRIRKPMRLSEAQATSHSILSELTLESEMHAVWQNGTQKTLTTHFSIDYETGEVVFVSAPSVGHVIEWAGYFVCAARFGPNSDQQLSQIAQSFAERSFDEIDIEEIIEATSMLVPERFGGAASYFIEDAAATQRILGFGDGEFIRIDADAVSPSPFPVKLPALDASLEGGPFVRIVNIGASKSLDIQTSTGTSLNTVLAGETIEYWIGINSAGTGQDWVAL